MSEPKCVSLTCVTCVVELPLLSSSSLAPRPFGVVYAALSRCAVRHVSSKSARPKASTPPPSREKRNHESDGDLRACLETLIRHLQDHPGEGTERSDVSPDVLLDTQVADVRCLLIKVPPDSHRHRIQLSPREHEIVRMVAAGHPNKTIAAVLDISCWTVGTYLRRIFAKLGVGSRAAMVARIAGEPRAPVAERSPQGAAAPEPAEPAARTESTRFRHAG